MLDKCPKSPNCVCSNSDSHDAKHAIEGFLLNAENADAWSGIFAEISAMPRVKVVDRRDDYLHVEFKSKLLRFVDDFELQLDLQSGKIGVRSASRLGYSDMNVNRKRVEKIRSLLQSKNLIK